MHFHIKDRIVLPAKEGTALSRSVVFTPAEPKVHLSTMNKFVLEPTDENIERYKRVQGRETFWHTSDFFKYDRNLEAELSVIFRAYMDALTESDEEDEDEAERKIGLLIGRMLVKAARKAGISPQDYRDQFNNYAAVIWTPICTWQKDNLGNINYSLMSS